MFRVGIVWYVSKYRLVILGQVSLYKNDEQDITALAHGMGVPESGVLILP